MVIEDSAVYRKPTTNQLQNCDFGITIEENGAPAWQSLPQPSSPKLVLLDCVLPDMDGTELCQRIRQAEHLVTTFTSDVNEGTP